MRPSSPASVTTRRSDTFFRGVVLLISMEVVVL